jgi:adenylate cyclase
LGRSAQNDIRLDDPSISREHLLIRHFDGQFTLFDRGSRIGTLVNQQQVTSPCLLQHGDRVTVGDTELEFATASQVSHVS